MEARLRDHHAQLDVALARALGVSAEAGHSYEGVVMHTGAAQLYPSDDQERPFRPWPHFARYLPLEGPDHLLVLRPGERMRLVRVAPRDYWFAQPAPLPPAWATCFELAEVQDAAAAVIAAGDVAGLAFLGPDPRLASTLGLPEAAANPSTLLAALDWERAFKSEHEVACVREAAEIGARGHAAVRAGLSARGSEFALHQAFLAAAGLLESESPYPNIVAWDAHAAVLHYAEKCRSAPEPGASFLIDAGGASHGYASDITRSYALPEAPAPFRTLLSAMESLQRDLVARVGPDVSYIDLHARAILAVGQALREVGVIRCGVEEANARGWLRAFMPHGLGHHLGLQVHDVGGRQRSPDGAQQLPPPELSYLRTTRELAPGHIVTVEPGCYFIPMLLDPLRAEAGEAIDWALVETLLPCGGIRVEDDVLVTRTGHEDLTRPLVPAGGTLS